MCVSVAWHDNSRRILLYVFDRAWTWDEFNAAQKRADMMLNAEPHPVAIVFDLPYDADPPAGFVSQLPSLSGKLHPRVYALVVAGGSTHLRTLIRTLVDVSKPLGSDDLRVFNSFDAGRAWIETQSPYHEAALLAYA